MAVFLRTLEDFFPGGMGHIHRLFLIQLQRAVICLPQEVNGPQKVVFPLPEGPRITVTLPVGTVMDTSRRTVRLPKFLFYMLHPDHATFPLLYRLIRSSSRSNKKLEYHTHDPVDAGHGNVCFKILRVVLAVQFGRPDSSITVMTKRCWCSSWWKGTGWRTAAARHGRLGQDDPPVGLQPGHADGFCRFQLSFRNGLHSCPEDFRQVGPGMQGQSHYGNLQGCDLST